MQELLVVHKYDGNLLAELVVFFLSQYPLVDSLYKCGLVCVLYAKVATQREPLRRFVSEPPVFMFALASHFEDR